MNAKPILFSGSMVRALLAGNKTQTRRIIKNHPLIDGGFTDEFIKLPENNVAADCKYGAPGDYLWVRETWQPDPEAGSNYPEVSVPSDSVCYAADIECARDYKWRPSIHMPRWASRLTLHITDVRVERLQDISEEDAKAEGVESPAYPAAGGGWIAYDDGKWADGFAALWESIHGPGSWGANPWLWAISFRVIKQNIDQVLLEAA